MKVSRSFVPALAGAVLACGLMAGPARAFDELTGHVKSVGADLKTFVVTEAGTGKDVTVTVTPQTSIVSTEGRRLELRQLEPGDGVGITHTGSVASRILVNVRPVSERGVQKLTGHVKSVGADLKTFVVTETGTNTDVTVAVNPQTTIESTEGKTLEMRDLKPGDGVGITHSGSVARKILVYLKTAR